MKKRGTDTEKAIQDRIDRYDFEMSYKDRFDHVIINDNLEVAQKEILEIVNSIV
jgi:guanylate kinase